ncbi:hypothetical protein DFP72DRAFT_909711 [Ephemerocybe angulata]|uniref:Uncharacterized protein n=1 Tax=Ephemerocybe angulata TaxID=980116 RepID=A0A8H6HP93_9AGAR|nr:hypothetical protein DFP72DRAFT_909711 [Tulosesus angulatus]
MLHLFTTLSISLLFLTGSCSAQITYRRRATSPARIIAGCVVGGLALTIFLFALCMLSRRRKRAMRYNLAAIPRPHAGEKPYYAPQQQSYAPGASLIIDGGLPMQKYQDPQTYPAQQYPAQAHSAGSWYGGKLRPEDEPLPLYEPNDTSDTTRTNANAVQSPAPIHNSATISGQNQPFVPGFRPTSL